MEPLALLAVLVAIICVGYIVVNIAFKMLNTALDFFDKNKLAVILILILALMLAFWLRGYQF
jgi:hypothetical protein